MKRTTLRRNWKLDLNGVTREISIPYDFSVGLERRADAKGGADEGFFPTGRANYYTVFEADPASHAFLSFDGVMGLTEVYLNGNFVKFHPYGYTAFLCDVQPYLKERNELLVIADTEQQTTSRWYTGGGIFRDVTLLTSSADYIVPNSVFVKTKNIRNHTAYVSVEFKVSAEKAQTAEAYIEIPEIGVKLTRYLYLDRGETAFSVSTMLKDITPWSPDTPALYTCSITLKTESSEDSDTSTFGIRTVECDPENGLLLNGEPVKLYGACVHHDNGIIGAASYSSAEERRVRILKENGFNAIRCAHNPPSAAMLDACDRLGMLVIDEIFDAWRLGKRNFDYHVWFERYWAEDTDNMVLRDRRHPSVIMWSTGNEIFEKTGASDGYHTSRMIADRIRMNDDTRPVTHAFCSFWNDSEFSRQEYETLNYPADRFDFFTERIRYTAGTMDVYGYNYLLDRMAKDEVRFPDMLFSLTESYPLDAVKNKKYMDAHPRMTGEFVWTGWDYFGETGIGHVKYGIESTAAWGLTAFPNHIADCGDIDICGFRRPQSYYREAAWNDGSVRILTRDPEKYGQVYAMSAWGFYDVSRTWTYPGKDGMTTEVYVFTTAPSCELLLNGKSLGKKNPDEKGIAVFEVPYAPGTLSAVSYSECGCTAGEDTLATTASPKSIGIRPCDINDLVYFEITLLDENGNVSWTADDRITITAENGTVIGTGSGKNETDHVYTSTECDAYHGRILAAVLPDADAETITVTVSACGMSAHAKAELIK